MLMHPQDFFSLFDILEFVACLLNEMLVCHGLVTLCPIPCPPLQWLKFVPYYHRAPAHAFLMFSALGAGSIFARGDRNIKPPTSPPPLPPFMLNLGGILLGLSTVIGPFTPQKGLMLFQPVLPFTVCHGAQKYSITV